MSCKLEFSTEKGIHRAVVDGEIDDLDELKCYVSNLFETLDGMRDDYFKPLLIDERCLKIRITQTEQFEFFEWLVAHHLFDRCSKIASLVSEEAFCQYLKFKTLSKFSFEHYDVFLCESHACNWLTGRSTSGRFSVNC